MLWIQIRRISLPVLPFFREYFFETATLNSTERPYVSAIAFLRHLPLTIPKSANNLAVNDQGMIVMRAGLKTEIVTSVYYGTSRIELNEGSSESSTSPIGVIHLQR